MEEAEEGRAGTVSSFSCWERERKREGKREREVERERKRERKREEEGEKQEPGEEKEDVRRIKKVPE